MEEIIKYRVAIYYQDVNPMITYQLGVKKVLYTQIVTDTFDTYRQALDAYGEIINNQKVDAKVSIEKVYEEISFRKSIY